MARARRSAISLEASSRAEPPPPPRYAIGDPPFSSPDIVERAADFALAETPRVLSVLDVGCGDGSLLHEIALRVPYCERYVGVDPVPSMLEAARQRPDQRIEYFAAEATSLQFPDDGFDLAAAEQVGLRLDDSEVVTRRFTVITGLRGFALIL